MAGKDLVYLFLCRAKERKRLIEKINNKYPNILVVDIGCSGRFNPEYALKLINKGASGVLILGCTPADCIYREGSLISERRLFLAKKILSGFGLNEEKLQVMWHKINEVEPVLKEIDKFMNEVTAIKDKEGVEKV